MEKKLVGEKVILREQRREDAEYFTYWFNQSDVMFKGGRTEPVTLDEEVAMIDQEQENCDWYTITDKKGRVLGETGLMNMLPAWRSAELSIMLPNPEDQGHGYGTEAINLMFQLAFERYQFNRVAIGVVEKNTYGLKFYDRVGFKKEGAQDQGYYYDGEYCDIVLMRILRNEWLNSQKRK